MGNESRLAAGHGPNQQPPDEEVDGDPEVAENMVLHVSLSLKFEPSTIGRIAPQRGAPTRARVPETLSEDALGVADVRK